MYKSLYKKVAPNRSKKYLPAKANFEYNTIMKNHNVQIKLCKKNHRVQSKTSNFSFLMELRFETKIDCFVTKLCTFAFSYSSAHSLNLQ